MNSADKLFVLRFDIDTHICIGQGVPKLLRYAKQAQIQLSFFINMGKAVSRRHVLVELTGNKVTASENTYKLSNAKKLGILGYLTSAIINPWVGKNQSTILQNIVADQHDLGLHGGRNHALWQREANTRPPDWLREEIQWGIRKLSECGINKAVAFASPGWNSSAYLSKILEESGFKIIADQHGQDLKKIVSLGKSSTLISVPTNLVGEPGGVGYIEYLRARYKNDDAMLDRFAEDLKKHQNLAVMYDHPAYVGRCEIDFLGKLVKLAQNQGYSIVRISKAVKDYSENVY